MPTLTRLTAWLAAAAVLVLAGMYGLASFVHPTSREMVVTIPLDLQGKPVRNPDGSMVARSAPVRLDDPKRLPKILEASRLSR